MTSLKTRLVGLIAQNGPLTIAQYMHLCLHDPEAGYYATRVRLGADGDFITAPETSQMFGEMLGLWCAQSFLDLGSPSEIALIEAGPGSGAMAVDLWRASKALPGFRAAIRLYLIEPSAMFREAQKQALGRVGAEAIWISDLSEVPPGPTLLLGNEVLDCLPIRQFVRTESDWRERLVGVKNETLVFGLAPEPTPETLIPEALRAAEFGSVAETSPTLAGYVARVAERLNANSGRALFIDYGAAEITGGDTFQAVRAHKSADPLEEPGAADLTAHVDFTEVSRIAKDAGLSVAGPVPQGAFLLALGIETRAQALHSARPENASVIARQLQRLVGADQMGGLFQAICLSSVGLPAPAGYPASA